MKYTDILDHCHRVMANEEKAAILNGKSLEENRVYLEHNYY